MECEHKFKIIKQFKKISKNILGMVLEDTIYHLQCEKCGDLISRIVKGYCNDPEFSEKKPDNQIEEKEENNDKSEERGC